MSAASPHLASPERTLTFGLGAVSKIDSVEIRWPDGSRETRRDVAPGATVVIEEGVAASSR